LSMSDGASSRLIGKWVIKNRKKKNNFFNLQNACFSFFFSSLWTLITFESHNFLISYFFKNI
jgi:hypothetical protein